VPVALFQLSHGDQLMSVVLQLKSTRLADYDGIHGSRPRAVAVADGLGRSPSEEFLLLLLLAQSNCSCSPYQYFFLKLRGWQQSNGAHATMLGALERSERDRAIFFG